MFEKKDKNIGKNAQPHHVTIIYSPTEKNTCHCINKDLLSFNFSLQQKYRGHTFDFGMQLKLKRIWFVQNSVIDLHIIYPQYNLISMKSIMTNLYVKQDRFCLLETIDLHFLNPSL